jgi:uncharacterized glyoxalase superfamily protein PhnB
MTNPTPPIISNGITPIFNVNNFAASVAYYRDKLLFTVDWEWGDPPSFGSVTLGGKASLFLCEQAQGAPGTWVSLFLDDVDAYYERIKETGAIIKREPQDEPWGCRELLTEDPDGHVIRFTHSIPVREPKLPVERVPLEARLEKRLAALLHDLAEHKGLSLTETLEETLLHTFEQIDDEGGVASPHTLATLRFIQELKQKHGIDYDTHDTYRFAEKDDPPLPEE